MRSRLRFIVEATLAGWRWLVELSNHIGAALILLGVVGVSVLSGWTLPHWWWGLLILAACYVVLFGEGAYRVARESSAAESDADISVAALLLGTELRSIRHSIELVRERKPPSYSRGFRLPGFRWDEYDEALSTRPDLYAIVAKAYTASHHVNQVLEIRENQNRAAQTFAVLPDEELDAAYDTAGNALDALGEPRGEPWATQAGRAIRVVVEDIARGLGERNDPPS